VGTLRERWLNGCPASIVPRALASALATRPTSLVPGFMEHEGEIMEVGADFIPVILVCGMPAAEYVNHMEAMVRIVLAELLVRSPHMAPSVRRTSLVRAATVVTAVRCGVWSATQVMPSRAACTVHPALYWSVDKARLYVRPPCASGATDLWRHMYSLVPGGLETGTELMDVLAGLAPVFLRMGSSNLVQSGADFIGPAMEQYLSSILRKRLSPHAYSVLDTASPSTWELLTTAGLTGMSLAWAQYVSTDSVLSAGCRVRMANNGKEYRRYARQEAAAIAGIVRAGSTTTSSRRSSDASPDDLAWLLNRPEAADDPDDTQTVFGASSGPSSPGSDTVVGTVVPSPRADSPEAEPPDLDEAQIAVLRESLARGIRQVVQETPLAPSAVGHDDVDPSVRF
jgi:hypothetical protein